MLPYGEKFDDEEKVDFPSYDTPVPTFSAAYGEDVVPPQPAHVPLGSRILGPRFFAQGQDPVSLPIAAVNPQLQRARGHLARQESSSSQRSESSVWSESSETPSMKGKRWVIE